MTEMTVRDARWADIPAMVKIIERQRSHYELSQRIFWRRASNADAKTSRYYRWLLVRRAATLLIGQRGPQPVGFLTAVPTKVPPVYAPGGPTMMIDDFAVSDPADWPDVGGALLNELKARGRSAGWSQIVAVCGAADLSKSTFLRSANLSMASTWWVGAP